jgi:hypothetical protein
MWRITCVPQQKKITHEIAMAVKNTNQRSYFNRRVVSIAKGNMWHFGFYENALIE